MQLSKEGTGNFILLLMFKQAKCLHFLLLTEDND